MPTFDVATRHRESGKPGPTMQVDAPSAADAARQFEGTSYEPMRIDPVRTVPVMTPIPFSQPPQPHAMVRPIHGTWYHGPWGSVVRILIVVFLLGGFLMCLIPF